MPCCSCQGTFDGEVVKILKFYGDKKRELLSRLDELQSDIDALPTQVTSLCMAASHKLIAEVTYFRCCGPLSLTNPLSEQPSPHAGSQQRGVVAVGQGTAHQ